MGTSGGFIDVKSLPTTGTYSILVDPQLAAIGSATLQLYDVPADLTPSIIAGGAPVTVTTTIPGQNAKLTFAGTAGRRISLNVGPACCSIKVSITKPDGTALVAATSMGTSGGYIDVKSLPTTGTYSILVDPQSSAIGSATLQLYDVPADASAAVTPGGAPVTVTTTIPGQNAKLTFAGTAGRGIALSLSGVTIGPSTTSSLKLSITKPDGTSLFAPALYGTNGTFIDTLTLPATGTYSILIDPAAASVGSGTVTLSMTSIPRRLRPSPPAARPSRHPSGSTRTAA
jgi:large repetitive protein